MKQRYEQLYTERITREGSRRLLSWMNSNTDFFTAPASTRFHLARERGLLEHSLNVYDALTALAPDEAPESVAICALLHDLCKVNFYKTDTRNVKNAQTGQWEKQPYYSIDDSFPYGHGEKSVYLIERFFLLKPAEAMAIRWHMGAFDPAVKGGAFELSRAFERYPLLVKLHMADLQASYLIDAR